MKKVLNWKVLIILFIFLAGIFVVNSIYAEPEKRCFECNTLIDNGILIESVEATCEAPGYEIYDFEHWCVLNTEDTAKVEIESALGHEYINVYENYNDVTHVFYMECSREECDDTKFYQYSPHVFDNYIIIKDATCSQNGEVKMTCNLCGGEHTKETEKKEHANWEYRYSDVGDGTHLVNKFCFDCESSFDLQTSTHVYKNYEYNDDATCTEDGTETGTCVCGDTDTRTKEGSAIGHSEYTVYFDVDDGINHIERVMCEICGEEVSVSTKGHSSENYVYNEDATCTEDGTETGTCACGATLTRTKEGSKTGHNIYTIYKGYMENEHEAEELCATCGESINQVFQSHTYENYQYNNDATCELAGTETGTCVCGATNTRYVEGSELGHDLRPAEYVRYDEQSCTKNVYCMKCEKLVSSVLQAHQYENYQYNNDATCEKDGTETGTCACGDTNTRTKAGTKLEHDVVSSYEDLNQNDHGVEDICSICGEGIGGYYQEHTYENYQYNNDATCTADGTETGTCVCGRADTRTKTGTKLDHSEYYIEYDQTNEYHVIHMYCGVCNTEFYTEQLEHTYENYIYNNDATCELDGTETGKCVCGKTDTRTKTGTKLDHTYTNYTYNNDATCTADGTETGTCVCGKSDTRTKTGTKLNHTYTNYTYNNDATCTEEGTETGKCVCGAEDTRTKAGTKLDHTYTNYTYNNDATCELDGTETGTCVCGDTHTITKVGSILDHSFGEWVIDKPATYEEDGHKYRICTNCNTEKEEQTIPKLTNEEFEVSTELNTKEQEGKTYVQSTTSTTVQELLNNITSNKELEVVDKNGNVLEGTANLGTGAKVLQKETKEEVYTLVVCGDITGDGKISVAELAVASKMAVNSPIGIDSIQFMALDVSKDNRITISDLAALARLMTKQLFK